MRSFGKYCSSLHRDMTQNRDIWHTLGFLYEIGEDSMVADTNLSHKNTLPSQQSKEDMKIRDRRSLFPEEVG
jgi:hypothetical protein